MNKDQVKGRVTEAAGKVKEAFGKMTGNKQTRETCLRNGVAPDGFTVTAVEGAVPAGGRSVSVCFGREICQYDGNQTAQWTVDIEDDLRSLVFS